MSTEASTRPAGPAGHPILGNFREFVADPPEFLAQQVRDFGGLSSFRLLYGRIYLVSDPELVRSILITDAKDYTKHPATVKVMKRALGEGLVTSSGELHASQRRLVQPAFQVHRVKAYGAVVASHSEKMLAKWQSGETRQINQDMHHLTMDIVTETLFNVQLSDDDYSVGQAIGRLQSIAMHTLTSPLPMPYWLPTPLNRASRRERRALDEVISKIVSSRRGDKTDKGDLLSVLLNSEDAQAPTMTDEQLRDEVVTLFAAGHETTANALSWAFALLSEHPHIQSRMHEELDRVLQGRAVTIEDVESLPLTAAIFKESLRVRPTVWVLGARKNTKTITLAGHPIPAGSTFFISPYAMHRNPDYFDNADNFDPDRWIDGRTDKLHRLAYLPFGAGPRVCIGQQFAIQEGIMIIAAIAQKFSVQMTDNKLPKKLARITLAPVGNLSVLVQAR